MKLTRPSAMVGLVVFSLLRGGNDSSAPWNPRTAMGQEEGVPALRRQQRPAAAPREIDVEVEVAADWVDVFDQPDQAAFITGRAYRGDRLRARVDWTPGAGWLAIQPLSTTICWVEQSRLEQAEEKSGDSASGTGTGAWDRNPPTRAWVSHPGAVVRSGHPQARLPGPPCGKIPGGTMVQLVDRPPLILGQESRKTLWMAIVPPEDSVFYVPVAAVHWLLTAPVVPVAAEVRASHEESTSPRPAPSSPPTPDSPSSAWPADVVAELDRIDGIYRAILTSGPVEKWRFETVRAGYQNLLKSAGDRTDLEETVRTRLARVSGHERAARSARTIEEILAKSRRRDAEVNQVRRELARVERSRERDFAAIGFVQPSARKVDGHKVFALIGRQGAPIAFLDIPPGLDPEPFLARRVGVRGQARFSEDLGARLITVRDLESVEATR